MAAIDAVKYLVWLAQHEAEPDPLTPPRVQKLLYYVQGWSLAERRRPLFPEAIQAGVHGPVVAAVQPFLPTSAGEVLTISDAEFDAVDLSDEDRVFIAEVWEAYKPYSASSLREMTQREAPWREARNGLRAADRGDVDIPLDSLARFFRKLAEAA